MIESKHRSALHALLSPTIYSMGTTGISIAGVPDAYYSGSKTDLWCEHKRFAKCPRRINLTRPSIMKPRQRLWLLDRHNEGRNVAVVVFTDDLGHAILYGDTWTLPIEREAFHHIAMNRRALAKEIIDYVGANNNNEVPPV